MTPENCVCVQNLDIPSSSAASPVPRLPLSAMRDSSLQLPNWTAGMTLPGRKRAPVRQKPQQKTDQKGHAGDQPGMCARFPALHPDRCTVLLFVPCKQARAPHTHKRPHLIHKLHPLHVQLRGNTHRPRCIICVCRGGSERAAHGRLPARRTRGAHAACGRRCGPCSDAAPASSRASDQYP